MVKIKYDVSESDPDEAKAAGTFEAIKPGLYLFDIIGAKPGFSKGDDKKEDPSRPYVEVTFACLDPKYKGAQVWGYFIQKGHPSYDKKAAEKFDQLLLAVKFTDGKTKRKGEIDLDKDLKGKKVVVRVRAGTNQSGEARGEFGSVFPADTPTGSSATTTASPDEELIEDDEDIIEEEEELTVEEETDWVARKIEMAGADVATLKTIAKEYGVAIAGLKKSQLVDALIEWEQNNAGDGEMVLEEDEEILVEEEEVLSTTEYISREQLVAMETADLVKVAKDFDLKLGGKKKSEVVEMIIQAQANPADIGEPPF